MMKKLLSLFSIAIAFSLAIFSCQGQTTPSPMAVFFDPNTGNGTMAPQIFEANVPQTLRENTFTKDGYTFEGWAFSSDAAAAVFADKAILTLTANITLYAVWKAIPPVPKFTISYVSAYGTKPDNKVVNEGYKLTAEDLPDLGESGDSYFASWNKTLGTEITADTTITAAWETIVYLKNFKSITDISSNKSTIQKIVFTKDSYTGASATFDCSDTAGYYTGVLENNILTVYGNGHKIYAPVDCSQMFYNYKDLKSIEFSNFYTSKTTNMSGMFAMSNALNSLNVSGFNTAKVTNMTGMFTGYKDTVLNLSNFDTSKVENMKNMFQACTNLTTLNISSFNTSAVTDMSNMFYGCSSLTSLDVSKFVTAKVTNMYQMFANCYGLEELDLSGFDTSEVTNMSSMFYCTDTNKSNLKKIIFSSKFKTDKVTNVKQMFYQCDKLTELDLSSFDTSSVLWTSIGGCGLSIFNGCSSLVTIYATEKFNPANKDLGIFDGCTNLVGGAGTKYSDCETSDPDKYKTAKYARIDGGPTSETPGYFTLKQ
ncbi:MAG: BspA family leucine-rich repeat surface protein [Treponema sp.]|nr:BspA family leucine-rich repeat surface protein [Candidatus Treponema merdequi]